MGKRTPREIYSAKLTDDKVREIVNLFDEWVLTLKESDRMLISSWEDKLMAKLPNLGVKSASLLLARLFLLVDDMENYV